MDPNNELVFLQEMFQEGTSKRVRNDRGSSARNWNDKSEFLTPNLIAKAADQNFAIDIDNVNKISTFNPFEIVQVSSKQK